MPTVLCHGDKFETKCRIQIFDFGTQLHLIDYNITIELGRQSSMASLSMASRYSTLSRLAVSPRHLLHGFTEQSGCGNIILSTISFLESDHQVFCCMSLHVFVHNILSPPFLQYHTFLLVFPHWILWCPPIDLMNQVEENLQERNKSNNLTKG